MPDPPRGDPPLALLGAVALETSRLHAALEGPADFRLGGVEYRTGRLAGRPVVVAATGMGKVNAAHGLTALAAARPLAGVIGVGIAGAYETAGAGIGEVVVASEAVYADEGVEAPGGWLDTEGMGIPLLTGKEGPRHNRFPLAPGLVEAAMRILAEEGVPAHAAVFATVSTCSGTSARGREVAARYGAGVEEMEGAALAHVATRYRLPLLLVRGVSNRVVDRDPAGWEAERAASAAQGAVGALVRRWGEVGCAS